MKRKMAELDRNRAGYYSFFSGNKWGDKDNYDLMLNTTGKDIKSVTDALADYLRKVLY